MVVGLWIGFIVLVLGLLALDLGVFNRKAHVIGTREAMAWTAFWISLALVFDLLIYIMYQHHWWGVGLDTASACTGHQAALDYLAGYLIEKSLSLDNIAVIALVFSYFRVPAKYQHRVLFWGILGAVIMRGAMIGAGVALIRSFTWIVYVFGGLLLISAAKMLRTGTEAPALEKNRVVRLARRILPVSDQISGPRFFTKSSSAWVATPLFLVLLLVESSDVVFAIDSIPAILAITKDPFLVFTSNIFAILGLRSLYFVLASLLDRFRLLKLSLVAILAFVGVKMLLSRHLPIPTSVSLAVVLLSIAGGVGGSLLLDRN